MSTLSESLIEKMNNSEILQKANPEASIKILEQEMIKTMRILKFTSLLDEIKKFIETNKNINDIYNFIKDKFQKLTVFAYDSMGERLGSNFNHDKINEILVKINTSHKYGFFKIGRLIFIHINNKSDGEEVKDYLNNIICIIPKMDESVIDITHENLPIDDGDK